MNPAALRNDLSALHSAALAALVLSSSGSASAQVDFRGELVGSLVWTDADSDAVPGEEEPEEAKGLASLRYLPELMIDARIKGQTDFTFVGSANLTATAARTVADEWLTDSNADLYRLWARLASPRLEFRVGLQKISFGSATLLRPLQWFDQLDPRDPLQITDGVEAGLFRYTALNNTNLSLWLLYGNDEVRGWDVVPSDPNEVEFGGRLQFPLFKGELGLSYHHRDLEPSALLPAPLPESTTPPEHRVGLDGKWDVGVGLWFEGAVIERDTDLLPYRYRHMLTVGADYTFDLGTGLTALGEHFRLQESSDLFGSGEMVQITALSMSYRTSIIDQLTLIASREWEGDESSFFFEWRRTWNRWRLHLIGFSAPEGGAFLGGPPTDALYSGNGLQVVVVFNH